MVANSGQRGCNIPDRLRMTNDLLYYVDLYVELVLKVIKQVALGPFKSNPASPSPSLTHTTPTSKCPGMWNSYSFRRLKVLLTQGSQYHELHHQSLVAIIIIKIIIIIITTTTIIITMIMMMMMMMMAMIILSFWTLVIVWSAEHTFSSEAVQVSPFFVTETCIQIQSRKELKTAAWLRKQPLSEHQKIKSKFCKHTNGCSRPPVTQPERTLSLILPSTNLKQWGVWSAVPFYSGQFWTPNEMAALDIRFVDESSTSI